MTLNLLETPHAINQRHEKYIFEFLGIFNVFEETSLSSGIWELLLQNAYKRFQDHIIILYNYT